MKKKVNLDTMNSKSNRIEEYLKEKILSDLERGRPDFDKTHTLAVVYWLNKIVEHSPELCLDNDVLLISAYAHDWGMLTCSNKDSHYNMAIL